MKKIIITILKFIGFFLGWAVLTSILPLSSSEVPAVWRLWAEIMPLLTIIVFTFIFWLIEKKSVELHLFDNPVKGIVLGVVTGVVWLAIPVLIMCMAKIIHFESIDPINLFPIWVLAAFLNVIMQELLVRGYLYQMIKQNHNIVAAVIITTILFTALHGGAFEAGVVPVLNVFTMSLLMTAVLEYSGSIIAPIIMHFLWNGVGALVLGGVSLADDYPHLFITKFTGNEIISGGACKIEGSIIVLFVNVFLIVLFMFLKNSQKTRK
ncbi:MAG: CPBP family intramembrane metalloprotease [Clostridium sp.]|nr:CPBP family intramembrane metalloprotease [Clostridium sp.]MCM1548162.1 CPBP family intramembrane metalloprotease [Ruminococcus sp.]